MANTWSMARNPEKYPDPTRFMPERYMSKVASEESVAHGRDDISFAFGFGRRVWYDGRNSADKTFLC
ncbi:hypothetical protein AZE42_09707 [Rhizopogon vesiculosus]|uniref:Cytochrome P450 n=1 Tax=Rhizopogon vesiculosus TaxID=180088 RepID=A0A1J8PS91_9AGAM|nr:hypothetical protein AZE42_09707 [Rhizopogon vesiculosus]